MAGIRPRKGYPIAVGWISIGVILIVIQLMLFALWATSPPAKNTGTADWYVSRWIMPLVRLFIGATLVVCCYRSRRKTLSTPNETTE